MKELGGEQLLALAMSAAIKIYKENDPDEVMILSDFFSLLGMALQTLHDAAPADGG